MVARLTGAGIFLLGMVIAILASWGLFSTVSLVSADDPGAIDGHQWLASWRISSVMLILIGLSIAIAGIAVSAKRAWGFLLLATGATVTAVFPWVLLATDSMHYAFEIPRVEETGLSIVVVISSAVAYFFSRRRWHRRGS